MQGTIDYFLDLGVESIAPCHCVDLPSRMTLNESIPVREVGTGTVIELPLKPLYTHKVSVNSDSA